MPNYTYACKACGHQFDIHQAFSDAELTTCPQCNGALRKVLSNIGVTFKGGGFYRTDNRTSGKSSGSAKPAGDSSSSKPKPASAATPPA